MPRAKNNADNDPAEAPEQDGGKTRHDKPRLTITLTDDGKPDIENMRAATLEKVRAFLRDKDNLKALGLAESEADEYMEIADEFVDGFYLGIGKANAFLFSVLPMTRIPFDIANEVFSYSEPELAALRQPTKGALRFLYERFPWLTKAAEYQDLVVVATLNYLMTSRKLKLALKLRDERARATVEAEGQPGAGDTLQ